MISGKDIYQTLKLTESFFSGELNEVKTPGLDDLLKMPLSRRIEAIDSMLVLRDKPRLRKLTFEGIAALNWMRAHGGKVGTKEQEALEKIFGFKAFESAYGEALKAYNKKLGYEPSSMTQNRQQPNGKVLEEKAPVAPASGAFNHQQMRGAKPSFQKKINPNDEKKIAMLKAQLLKTPLSQKQTVLDQIALIKAKYEERKTDTESMIESSEAEAIDAAIDDLQKEIDHKIWYMDKKKKDMSGPYGRVYSSEYRKNMRADFATYKEQIKAWKVEIAELKKKKKGVKESGDGRWSSLMEDHFSHNTLTEGGPGSGGQYPTKKIKMPMSPFISVGTRKGVIKNMPFEEEEVPLASITHVAQQKFVPFKVRRLLKNRDAITKSPVCLLKVPSENAYHVMDGHHRFLAAQQLGLEKLPAKVWIKHELPKEEVPAEAEPEANPTEEQVIIEPDPAVDPKATTADAPGEPIDQGTEKGTNEGMIVDPKPQKEPDETTADAPTAPIDQGTQAVESEVHEHFQMVCEKCESVMESCGCVNEEFSTRPGVCESCKAPATESIPSLDKALAFLESLDKQFEKLAG